MSGKEEEVMAPFLPLLSEYATRRLSGSAPDDPNVAEIMSAMQINMGPMIRFWLAAFEKVKLSYIRDKTVLEAMLRSQLQSPDGLLRQTFELDDPEDIEEFVQIFSSFMHRVCRKLP